MGENDCQVKDGAEGTGKKRNESKVMNGDEGRVAGKLSVLHDLYVDLLGSLVPGLLTVILGGTAILLTLSALHMALYQAPFLPTIFSGDIRQVLTGFHWEFATILIVSAYVIGAVFFRQDPKGPDAVSALHVWMSSKGKERTGLAVQSKVSKLSKALFLGDKDQDKSPPLVERVHAYLNPAMYMKKLNLDTQFPYLHLRCYLAARGLNHLIPLVPWCPRKEGTAGYRTKMFINILKIRLLSMLPDMSRDIIRNEAHVRLATSVWYASSALLYLAMLVLAILAAIAVVFVRSDLGSTLFVANIFAILLLLFCFAMRHHLRKCIHYMRVREVIYVLETAHLGEKHKGLELKDLIDKTSGNPCLDCPPMPPDQTLGT